MSIEDAEYSDALDTIDPVKWGDILPLLPKTWQKIGKPFPTRWGALILVSYSAHGLGNIYSVMAYQAPATAGSKGTLHEYKPYDDDDSRRSVSFNSRDGRRKIAEYHRWEIEQSINYDQSKGGDE